MTQIKERLIHFIMGKRFNILQSPALESEVVCPDCGGTEGASPIFCPEDGPERVWFCGKCKGQMPNNRHYKPRPAPPGLEHDPLFHSSNRPQIRENLSLKFRNIG